MTDTRHALEEAYVAIFGPEPPSEYDGRAWTRNKPDFSPAWTAYIGKRLRFRRFLDAEAWTDAAMCLVPEGWAVEGLGWHNLGTQSAAAYLWQYRQYPDGKWWHGVNEGRAKAYADTPALALAYACLNAVANKP